MTIANQHHFIVARKIPSTSAGLTSYTRALIAALTGNAHVPNPSPPLATLSSLLATFEAAETATKARTSGTVGVRNAARTALLTALRASAACVQLVADADPGNAEAIITSTSLSLRRIAAHAKPPFAVKQGPVSGTVLLAVKAAGPKAAYDWEWSGDGGRTWTQAPSTTRARTSIAALPVGTSVQFRFRSVTPKGETDWSQPIALLVK